MSNKNLGKVTAYGIALKNGFVGTELEWLASLKGNQGDTSFPLSIEIADNGDIIVHSDTDYPDGIEIDNNDNFIYTHTT